MTTDTTAPTDRSRLTIALDEFEERLPTIPASVLRLERAVAARATDAAGTAADGFGSAAEAIRHQARTSLSTVVGTARRAVTTTARAANTGARTVIGQGGAQATIVGQTVSDQVEQGHATVADGLGDLVEAVDPDASGAIGYERWSKTALYEKATELEIDGRSSMTRDELLDAVRSA